MQKRIILILLSISAGMIFTFYFLNKDNINIYAKEKYILYAFQVGAFENMDNAEKLTSNLPSSLIVFDDNLYRVYVGIYKNIDLVNKMLVYFENNNINIYLKNINVSKKFYNMIDNYEKILLNTEIVSVYNKINQGIIDLYKEMEINELNT